MQLDLFEFIVKEMHTIGWERGERMAEDRAREARMKGKGQTAD